ncbi:aldehyde dehydrogenase, dimeric NADP-preferring-like [Styela clava]
MDEPVVFSKVVEKARSAFESGITKPVEFRKQQLRRLVDLLDENEELLYEAAYKDMGKSRYETYFVDTHMSRNEVIEALQNVGKWMKPEYPKVDLALRISSVSVRKEPYGVCMILGSWNFPFLLTITPLVSAIAAGNCAVVKPSEFAPNCAKLIRDLIPKYLNQDCYPVVLTDAEGSAKLLNENKFDLIFYTGGANGGRQVMIAATKHLTPVVLELGGKNPCVVHRSSDLMTSARRLCNGKYLNNGQVCISPDYVLCDEAVKDEFLECLKKNLVQFFGENMSKSPDISRIVNDRHFQRVQKLLNSGKVVFGGEYNAKKRYIAPTILTDVPETSPVMKEEIFGPILPIFSVKNVDEAIQKINEGEKPLALYIFSRDKAITQKILDNTSSGGVAVNDTLIHFNHFQPFGGVGQSGIGNYHGKYGFDTFSHQRSVFVNKTPDVFLSFRYPPYAKRNVDTLRLLKKRIPTGRPSGIAMMLGIGAIGAATAYTYKKLYSESTNK